MKKYIIKSILILTVTISFGGCYTVLWSPEEQLPSENNNQIYYSEPYYGDYNYYYDYPWWLRGPRGYIAPVETPSSTSQSIQRTSGTVRDNNGSRSTPENDRPIVNTKPPSRSSQPKDNSGSASKTSSDNNSGQQTRSSDNSRSSDGNNSARNNNGNRNSESGRR
jgi:hypothetical protein